MITYKLPYKSRYDFKPIQKEFSSLIRYAYNRFLDELSEKEIRAKFKSEFQGISLTNSWIQQCAIREAKAILTRNEGKDKVVFGGKWNFKQRLRGKISKEKFQEKRILPLNIQGEAIQKGNRMFTLDIENSRIVYKHKKGEHHEIFLPKIRKNWKKKLLKLQERSSLKETPYQVRIDKDFIYISFEDTSKEIYLKNSRYLGIDLNPNRIGISILEDGKIIYTKEYDLSQIIQEIFKTKKATSDKRSKYLHAKLKHETIQIAKDIENLVKCWKVKYTFIEDLKFKQGDSVLGKRFNRLTKNLWKRNGFIGNLEKRITYLGGKLFKINPAYSSFIGNLCHDYSDPINASIEIARRGYDLIIEKNKKFYPDLTVETLKDQWKEYLSEEVLTWKELFSKIKNLKLKYRVSLDQESVKVFSLFHRKSRIVYFVY